MGHVSRFFVALYCFIIHEIMSVVELQERIWLKECMQRFDLISVKSGSRDEKRTNLHQRFKIKEPGLLYIHDPGKTHHPQTEYFTGRVIIRLSVDSCSISGCVLIMDVIPGHYQKQKQALMNSCYGNGEEAWNPTRVH